MKLSLTTGICVLLLTGCASIKVVSYQNWDLSKDDFLNRYEFTSGYLESNFFSRWSDGENFISHEKLYDEIFIAMDTDKNRKLSADEFYSKVNVFFPNAFTGKFSSFDGDSNTFLDRAEFQKGIKQSDVAQLWDTSGDGKITAREFASQMFTLADMDKSGFVDVLEFNVWFVNR